MLFAEVNDGTIALSRVWWVEEGATARLYIPLGLVRPDWRRKGLGAAMLRYDENHLREIARDHAATNCARLHTIGFHGVTTLIAVGRK